METRDGETDTTQVPVKVCAGGGGGILAGAEEGAGRCCELERCVRERRQKASVCVAHGWGSSQLKLPDLHQGSGREPRVSRSSTLSPGGGGSLGG